MKKLMTFCLVVVLGCTQQNFNANLDYPKSRKDTSIVDTYFGVVVQDPYRWLEDDNSVETMDWVKVQNDFTNKYLAQIPQREKIKNRLTKVWNYEKQSTPWSKGKYMFYYKNDGIQNQSVLFFKDTLTGEENVLIDPNSLSDDGTVALMGLDISKDAKYAAYMVSKSGSDWREIFVKEVATGKVLEDHIEWVKFSTIQWQENGFYYARYEKPKEGEEYSASNLFHKVYFHRLGTKQEEDQLIMEDSEHPAWNFNVTASTDETLEFLWITESTSGQQLWYRRKGESNFIPIDTTFNHEYDVIDNVGDRLFVVTNNEAPKNRLVSIELEAPEKDKWIEIIPEQEAVLESVSLCGENIVAKYLKDVVNQLIVLDYKGDSLGAIPLPGLGIVGGFYSSKESDKGYYSFKNYTTPNSVYEYDNKKLSSKKYWTPEIDFNSDDYVSRQVFYQSKDGTRIPMFITHKKGIKMDGNNPTFLYGYGGFSISIKPKFGVESTVFLENGGIYAVANLRGGGEYGEEWHKAGTLLQKQNVFDDFIAAAEYLIKEKYTNSKKMAVHGRSNGGLLIGAVMTQRPDLFQVCLPKVGVLDMLRYHQFTIGRAWAVDYGLSENEQDFKNLISYSPLHNVKEVNYPATMVLTGDHDDRVVPAHSFKFAATLQEKNNGEEPMLIRIDINAGHGSGKPVSMQIEEFSDTWAFVFHHLGMEI